MKPTDMLKRLHRKVIYYPELCPVLGGVNSTIMLCQLLYWCDKGYDPDGWIYKTQADLELETGLSRREQDTARGKLETLGLIQVKRRGVPPKLHYLVDQAAVDRAIELAWSDPNCTETPNQLHTTPPGPETPARVHRNAKLNAPNGHDNTEPTSELTKDLDGPPIRMTDEEVRLRRPPDMTRQEWEALIKRQPAEARRLAAAVPLPLPLDR